MRGEHSYEWAIAFELMPSEIVCGVDDGYKAALVRATCADDDGNRCCGGWWEHSCEWAIDSLRTHVVVEGGGALYEWAIDSLTTHLSLEHVAAATMVTNVVEGGGHFVGYTSSLTSPHHAWR